MFPGFEGVFLPWSWFVGGHPRDGHLRVRKDGDRTERVPSGGCHLEGPCEGCTVGVVCFLAPAHVGLVPFPDVPLLPGDSAARRPVI